MLNVNFCNNNSKHTYAGHLNSFTRLRALLELHDGGIFWPRQLASLAKRGGLRLVCGKRCTQGGVYPHIPTNLWLYLR
jgi:hypothetical protein